MFTTIGYSESQDAGAAFVKMAALADRNHKVYGDAIYIADFNRLFGAWALIGTTGTMARLISPSLRSIAPFYIDPVAQELYPAANFKGIINPNIVTPLDPDEPLEVEFYADPAAAERGSVIVWLSDSQIVPVTGKMYTVRAQITGAITAGVWNYFELDFIDELKVGRYAIVGAYAVISTAVAARFVPIGQSHTPGFPVSADEDLLERNLFRYGNLGKWCEFNHNTPPGIEVHTSANVGSATFEVHIDIMPI